MLTKFPSAENWAFCDPHELFLERAATLSPGDERAFIEEQITAFSRRSSELEAASRERYWDMTPFREGGAELQEMSTTLATFVGERARVYRAYAQALGDALHLLTPTTKD